MATGETGPNFPEMDEPTKLQGDGLGKTALGGFKTNLERLHRISLHKGGNVMNVELPQEEPKGDQTAE